MKTHCLQAIKIVHRFDWLISGHQSVNPLREAISVLSGKYKRFTFVHPVYCFKPGSHTSAIIGDCKTENVIEFVSEEFPVKHNTRCLTNIPDSYRA